MTPFAGGLDINSTELVSDRDKRKLADIEKSFEQLDKQPPKKKKRGSDGPILPSHSSNAVSTTQRAKSKVASRTASTSTQANGVRKSVSRHQSESPAAMSPKTIAASISGRVSRQASVPARSCQLSPIRKTNYVEASTQTDPEPDAWYSPPPRLKKRFVPLCRRLVENQKKIWAMQESRRASFISAMEMQSRMEGVDITSSHPSSPESSRPESARLPNGIYEAVPSDSDAPKPPVDKSGESVDTSMPDAPPTTTEPMAKPPPPSWTGVLQPVSINPSLPSDHRIPDLKIQMPTGLSLSSNLLASPSTFSVAHPLYSPAGSIAQSPLGTTYPSTFSPSVLSSVGQHPPPVKKKLSLSAYNAMKKKLPDASATPKAEPTEAESAAPSTPLKTSSSLSEGIKASDIPEKPAAAESPLDEKNKESGTTGVTVTVDGTTTEDKQSGRGPPL